VITIETDSSVIASGTFAGAGVTQVDSASFVFDPVAAGQGTHKVTYNYFNLVGTPFIIETSLIVDSIGAVDFVGLQDEYCVSAGLTVINALAPSGGTSAWTGPSTGFIPGDRTSILQPGTAGPGDYHIKYLYTSSTGQCQSEVTKSFVIHPLPVLDFVIRDLYNVDEPARTLSGTPSGGKFSGVGVTFLDPIYQFNPSIPGVRDNVPITYEYTDINSCWNSITKNTQVVAVNAFFEGWNTNDIYCYDQGQDTITVKTVDGINPGTGQFLGSPGFIKISDDTAIFDPVLAGPGLFELSYKYDNLLGAPFIIYKNIRVDSIGPVYFTGLQEEYCINEPRLKINPEYTVLARNFPTGGSHDWSGLSQGLIEKGEEAAIQTKTIGAGNHTLTYTFTSQYGCTRDTSESFIIHPLPVVSFTVRDKYDLQETVIPLTGNPAGGDFTGKGTAVNTEDSIFNPSAVGFNPEYNIVYTYTDNNGCTNYDTNTVEVFDYKVQFNSINNVAGRNVYCYNGGTDIITVVSTTGDSIVSGTFSGSGIHAQYNDTLEFDPAVAGYNMGQPHTISFNYLNEYNVPNTDSFKVWVDSVGAVYIRDLASEYCVNEPVRDKDHSYTLTAENMPEGGSHLWSGLTAGLTQNGKQATIRPYLIGPGTHQLTYTYTSAYSCSRDTTQAFIIRPNPEVYIDSTLRTKYDKAETSVTLLGYPLGGTFIGSKLAVNAEDSTFHPNRVGVNPEYNIIYRSSVKYIDSTCYNYDTVTVEVLDFTTKVEGLRLGGVYCADGDTGKIWVSETDGIGTLTSAEFSGPGIIINNGDSAWFDPRVAGPGNHTVTMRYINDYRCDISEQFTITVEDLGEVSILGMDEGQEFCIYDPTGDLNPVISLNAPNYDANEGTHTWTGLTAGLTTNLNKASISSRDVGPGNHSITYTYTSDNLCSSSVSKSFVIHSLPEVSFSIRQVYDKDESVPVPFVGSPGGPSGFFSATRGIQEDSLFLPALVGINPELVIRYTYTDTNSCTNYTTDTVEVKDFTTTIQGLRVVGGTNIYCQDGVSDTITAVTSEGTIINGTFTGAGIEQINQDKAVFDPASAGEGSHNIQYEYINSFGSPNSYDFNITVKDMGEITFLTPPEPDTAEYCLNDRNFTLLANPTNGSFDQKGIDYILGSTFVPANAEVGLNKVKYQVYDQNSNCYVFDSIWIKINGLPDIDIGLVDKSTLQDNDTVFCQLAVDSVTYFFNNTNAADGIKSHAWNFGDLGSAQNTSALEIPVHLYTSPGIKTISYTAETNPGCKTTRSFNVDIGKKPVAAFDWVSDCFNEDMPTSFTNNSVVGTLDEISTLTDFKWNIEDQQYATKNASHQFATPAEYVVKLVVRTQFGCGDSITKAITVRPTIKIVNPVESVDHYFEDFESGKMGWDREPKTGAINSWDFGAPYGKKLNTAYSGQNVWFTHMAGNNPKESSYILGPCFDFNGMDRPMIKMKLRLDTETDREGAVLQAKTNNFDWTRIGVSDGENWYNSFTIAANPGGQSFGWTGSTSDWEQVSHNLDDLIGFSYVRLRLAFAADGNGIVSGNEGVAFDDVWIGERTRKVLLEHFTNAGQLASQDADALLNEIVSANDWDAVSLQYHTHFPNQDPMNQQNQADLGSRALYYGISDVPLTLLNGGTEEKHRFDYDASTLTAEDILVEALKEPAFLIKDLSVNITGLNLKVGFMVEALQSISKREITLHVVAYEKEMTFNDHVYVDVVKKMLPDAGGTRFMRSWQAGDQETEQLSWAMQNVSDPSMVRVAVFLQDETTKEVYQAETSDTSTAHVIPSIGYPLSDMTELNFILYPNPAEDRFNIQFEQPLTERTDLELFNYLGTQVRELQMEPGTDKYTVEVGDLVKGIYFVRLKRDGRVMGYSRLVIMD